MVESKAPAKPMPLYKTFGSSAVAACWAEFVTLPLDTAKVALQTQSTVAGQAPRYTSMLGAMRTIAAENGAASLWSGLTPGLHRQCLFGGLRIGLYDPVKSFYVGKDHTGEVPLVTKIAAGLTTGALAMLVASPTDLVKVRMQAQRMLPPEKPRPYPSALAAYSMIVKQEGVGALWTGIVPNVIRNSVINATELATYDQFKEMLLQAGMPDNVSTHLLSGLGAGFAAVCVGSPVDVVKSRMMAAAPGTYSNIVDCFVKTVSQDGMMALYKGFLPNFARLGSWNVTMFLTLEQVKALVKDL